MKGMTSRRTFRYGKRIRPEQYQKASDELRTMTARALFYKLLLIGPTVFMGAIAVQSRLYVDDFSPVAYNQTQQEAITAYVEPVRMAIPLVNERKNDAAYAREVATKWVHLKDEGKLKPLMPVNSGDTLNEGVKREIKSAVDRIGIAIAADVQKKVERKDYDSAAKDIALALNFTEILKYSDFNAVSSESFRQRWLLRQLRNLAPKLTAEQRADVREELQDLPKDDQPIENLAILYKRYLAYDIQQEFDSTEPSGQLAMDTSFQLKQAESLLSPQLRRALHAQEAFREALNNTIYALSDTKA